MLVTQSSNYLARLAWPELPFEVRYGDPRLQTARSRPLSLILQPQLVYREGLSGAVADRRWCAGARVEIGEYRDVVRVPRRVFQRLLPERPTPSHVRRTTFSGPGSRASPRGSCN